MPVIDFSDVRDNAITPGEYTVTLTGSEYVAESRTTKKPYVKFEMTVSDDTDTAHNGRKVFRNFSLQPQSLWALKSAMIAFNADPEIFESAGLDIEDAIRDLYGNQALVTITNEDYNGQTQNRVGRIRPADAY